METLTTKEPRYGSVFPLLVAVALGLNVWLCTILIPAQVKGVWNVWPLPVVATIPLVVLAAAVWKRSEPLLLFLFPSALLIPIALFPDLVSRSVYGLTHFAVVAISFGTFVFGVSPFVFPTETQPIVHHRSLPPRQTEAHKRAKRVFLGLTAVAFVFPLVLLYFINFYPTNLAFLYKTYPQGEKPMLVILNLASLGGWFGLFSWAFTDILRKHQQGNQDILTTLALFQSRYRSKSRKLTLYGSTLLAFVFLALLFWYSQM